MGSGSVAGVLARMRVIDSAAPADGVTVFNRVYLRVTEMIADRLAAGGVFHDDAFITELDVRFADYWFEAYDARDAKPKAWAPLFAARAKTAVLPIQFALAGMNAHIEHDLPLAVVTTCAALGLTPESAGLRQDFDKVNELLASVEAEIRRSFLTEVEQSIDDHLGPVAHLVTSWNIEKARDFAWLSAQTLWELRRTRYLYDAYAATLGGTVGMGSRLLLTSFN